MREHPHDETPEERIRRERRGQPMGERLARLEERADSEDAERLNTRRTMERLEGRLWWLVTGGSLVGASTGAAAATAAAALFQGG